MTKSFQPLRNHHEAFMKGIANARLVARAIGPESLTRFAGQTATFQVQLLASAPVTCQWLFNGAPIPGQTKSLLALGPVAFEHAGHYTLVVSNAFGSVTSDTATLAVLSVPTGVGSVDISFDPTRGGQWPGLAGSWPGYTTEHAMSAFYRAIGGAKALNPRAKIAGYRQGPARYF